MSLQNTQLQPTQPPVVDPAMLLAALQALLCGQPTNQAPSSQNPLLTELEAMWAQAANNVADRQAVADMVAANARDLLAKITARITARRALLQTITDRHQRAIVEAQLRADKAERRRVLITAGVLPATAGNNDLDSDDEVEIGQPQLLSQPAEPKVAAGT